MKQKNAFFLLFVTLLAAIYLCKIIKISIQHLISHFKFIFKNKCELLFIRALTIWYSILLYIFFISHSAFVFLFEKKKEEKILCTAISLALFFFLFN